MFFSLRLIQLFFQNVAQRGMRTPSAQAFKAVFQCYSSGIVECATRPGLPCHPLQNPNNAHPEWG